jgi:hypothetical protein
MAAVAEFGRQKGGFQNNTWWSPSHGSLCDRRTFSLQYGDDQRLLRDSIGTSEKNQR